MLLRPDGQKIVMVYRQCFRAVVAALLFAVVPAGIHLASAAEPGAVSARTPPVADAPLFSVNDNYLTYSYLPRGADPGVAGKTEKQLYSFSHFDVWAYARTSPISYSSSRTTAIRPLPAATTTPP